MAVGPAEILVILIVALLVFGPQRLPEVGRQVGAAVRELRRMQDAVRGELDMVLHPEHGTSPADARSEPDSDVPATEPGDHTVLPHETLPHEASPHEALPHETGSSGDVDDGFSGPDAFI